MNLRCSFWLQQNVWLTSYGTVRRPYHSDTSYFNSPLLRWVAFTLVCSNLLLHFDRWLSHEQWLFILSSAISFQSNNPDVRRYPRVYRPAHPLSDPMSSSPEQSSAFALSSVAHSSAPNWLFSSAGRRAWGPKCLLFSRPWRQYPLWRICHRGHDRSVCSCPYILRWCQTMRPLGWYVVGPSLPVYGVWLSPARIRPWGRGVKTLLL